MLTNHYECPRCACAWSDTWSCQVDDDCPACGLRHISPADSEEAAAIETLISQTYGLPCVVPALPGAVPETPGPP
jgi:hypothetical protein